MADQVYAKCESCGWEDHMTMIAFNIGNALVQCRLCQTLFWKPTSFPTDVLETRWF